MPNPTQVVHLRIPNDLQDALRERLRERLTSEGNPWGLSLNRVIVDTLRVGLVGVPVIVKRVVRGPQLSLPGTRKRKPTRSARKGARK